jgi:signal transduction histidine kinase/CheY-like chemotaxis protein
VWPLKFGPRSVPDADLARAYRPTVRAYLGAVAAYNFLICLAHPFYEKGWGLVILETLAVAAVLTASLLLVAFRLGRVTLRRLELGVAATNLIFLANVFAYQTLHFEEPKLVYFLMLSLAFAAGAPTRRLSAASVAVSTACLIYTARHASGATVEQYAFIGLAGAFTALGMSMLMRNAVLRQLSYRLAAEALNRELEAELEAKRRLQEQAEVLAVVAQTASRAKSEFLATMSHEIRTPLNGVLGAAQAMERGELSDEQRGRLGMIQSSGQSLLQVINAILDISRIEAGKLELDVAPFDLDRFGDELARLYGGLAEEKGLTLALTIDPLIAGWRRGDASRLRQVASNMISNAIKFTDAGHIDIRFSGDRQTLVCAVSDTGVGIPADRLAHVFEKFVQVDGSATRRTGGSGLGLAICRELLGLMGGRIEAENLPRGGARFTFLVPCPSTAATTASETPTPAMEALDSDLRVLVVDDNETNRIVLQTMLGHLGVTSGLAEDGAEALELWEAGGWDVVLMDIHMPEMDGVQACQAIRAVEARTGRARTPVIAVTASVLSHETQAYLAAGLDGVVAKPIRAEELIAALDAALSPAPQADRDAG